MASLHLRSLEDRLREKTKQELKNEVSEAVNHAKRLIGDLGRGHNFPMVVKHEGASITVDIPLYDFFSQYEEQLLKDMFEKRHAENVQKFLAEVEGLQRQINELREMRTPYDE